MKIITFPFAGGNKYSFNYLTRHLQQGPNQLEVLEYPGRGHRVQEDFLKTVEDVVNDVFLQVEQIIDEEYMVYGHSMGALIGFLICQKIEQHGLKKPQKLIVSGRNAPKYVEDDLNTHLASGLFWKEVVKLGGIPQEVENQPELMTFFEPILRADFKCIEKFKFDENSLKLSIPIDVFYGSEEEIDEKEIADWKMVTSGEVNITKLSGKHFFIFDHQDFFIEYFKKLTINATI